MNKSTDARTEESSTPSSALRREANRIRMGSNHGLIAESGNLLLVLAASAAKHRSTFEFQVPDGASPPRENVLAADLIRA